MWYVSQHPQCLNPPKHLTDVTAWHQHIPFAFFITSLHRPSLFVELGVHAGDSYLAFCEGLVGSGLASYGPMGLLDTRVVPGTYRAVGIDTFEGDSHSGFYPAGVLEMLQKAHNPDYGAFSKLLVSTFDDAQPKFADGSIDLLHIDGCHTYEAVKHDFENWLPKLSNRGVVLFHDTAITDNPSFGVWRFWREVQANVPGRYPGGFSFSHGNGLGCLVVGSEAKDVLAFCKAERNSDGEWLRGFFRTLGTRITLSEPELFGRG